MTNTHIHVPERPFWDKDIYGNAFHNGVPVFSKLGRGPRGFQGDKGDKGDTGSNGEDGYSPWVEFDTTGEEPILIVHDKNGVHQASLTEGAQGPTGPQGPQGPAGPQGPQGPAGGSFDPSDITAGDALAFEAAITDNEANLIWIDYSWNPNTAATSSNGVTTLPVSGATRNAGTDASPDVRTLLDDATYLGRVPIDFKFHRNGLSYYYARESDPPAAIPVFNVDLSTSGSEVVTVSPSFTNGSGKLEECVLTVCFAVTSTSGGSGEPEA